MRELSFTVKNIDVLIYAEDPGAANYVAQIPAALQSNNFKSILLTDGLATNYLKDRGVTGEHIQAGQTADQILDCYKPRLVIIGTSENRDTLGLKLIEAAKLSGVESAAVVDLPVNADRRFCGKSDNPLEYIPDWLLVPDLATKSSYEQLGFKSDKVITCGHPHYDNIRSRAEILRQENRATRRQKVLPEAPENRPIVVFIAEPPSKLNPALSTRHSGYTMLGHGDSGWKTEIILQEFLDAFASCNPKPYIVLRLHPKNNQDEFQAYEDKVNFVSSSGDPLELLSIADLSVGMSSMLLQEAVLLGVPTLSILPCASEKSLLSSTASGLTPSVFTRPDLQEFVSQWIVNPIATKSKLPDTTGIFPPGSLERVVNFIIGLTNNVSV